MSDIVRLDNGKLVIISSEKRKDCIVLQESVYSRKLTNKIRKVFEEEN